MLQSALRCTVPTVCWLEYQYMNDYLTIAWIAQCDCIIQQNNTPVTNGTWLLNGRVLWESTHKCSFVECFVVMFVLCAADPAVRTRFTEALVPHSLVLLSLRDASGALIEQTHHCGIAGCKSFVPTTEMKVLPAEMSWNCWSSMHVYSVVLRDWCYLCDGVYQC